ncbi:MAG TPA: acyltransferase [Chitinispirillaceae bacterium]|nr:acyltransferase [Chitinispirillaceae bacterium]
MMNRILQRILRALAYSIPGGDSFRPYLHSLRGVHMGKNVWIGQYVYIDEIHPEAVFIGDYSTIGIGCCIIAHLYWGPRGTGKPGKVVIENDVFIGPHSVILPNSHIGKGAVIQAGTTVSKNVPPGVLYGRKDPEILANVTIPLTKKVKLSEYLYGIRKI